MDGLWVGNMFENPNTSVHPLWQYTHSSDNGAGTIIKHPATGEVLYYASHENEAGIQNKGMGKLLGQVVK